MSRNKGKVAIFYSGQMCSTGYYVHRTLEELGFTVDLFDPFSAYRIKNKIKGRYTAYICVDDSSHYSFPSDLSPSIFWFIDTPFSFKLDKIMSRYFDIVFCSQKIFAEKLSIDTGRKVEWLPLACYPPFHKQQAQLKIYDLAFVGSLDKERLRMRDLLERMGLKFFFGVANCQDIGKIYSSAKIVLNLNKRFGLNMRVFEGMCSGSMVLSKDFDGREDLFSREQLVVFSSEDDMFEKISYYLRNDEERERIARSGMIEVLEKHTYKNRVEKMFKSLDALHLYSAGKVEPSTSQMMLFIILEIVRRIWIKSGLRGIVVRKFGPVQLP